MTRWIAPGLHLTAGLPEHEVLRAGIASSSSQSVPSATLAEAGIGVPGTGLAL